MQSGILINGQWQSRTNHIADINPSDTRDVIEQYSWGSADDVAAAADAARQALPAWREVLPEARAKLLRKIGDEIYARADELAQLMSREQGKTLRESIGEVRRSGEIFHYFAGEAVRNYAAFAQGLRAGFTVTVSKEALGVVSIITPWNLPMSIPAWKIAPALAYGNTVIFKPSELTPGCAWALADIIHRAGVPAGVFNMVMGNGRELGSALIDLTDGVTFTGSNPTGVAVVNMAAGKMKKVQAELGGKSGLVIDKNADLDLAVEVAFQGAYHGTGQRCTASSRIIVLESVRDQFFERLIKRMKSAQVGHALEASTEIGPVVDERQLAKNCEYIGIARAEGAELLFGGDRLDLAQPGFYLQPALFLANDNKMRINQEEVFGPVASALVVNDLDEAIAVSNDVHFALSSGIVTNDLIAAEQFRRRSAAAMVTINAPTAGLDFHVPFGGRAPSGYGSREQGLAAHEFYTETKSSYANVSGRI